MSALRPSHWIILTISLALTGFVVWSMWAQLDQVTRAPGRVVPFARVQVVQSKEGGAISAINVREGDLVKRGQQLVELDQVQASAALEEARGTVAALRSRMARIDAELYNKPLTFPASLTDYPELTANQRQLYRRRRSALNSEVSSLSSMANLQEQELDLVRPLVETGDVARSEIISMRRAKIETEGRINTLRAQYIQNLQSEFTTTEEQLMSAEQQLAQRQDSMRAASLVAPTDGIVKNITLTTIGGVLRPGDEVLQIVPTGQTMIVQAKVSPRDIAFIRNGQRARIDFEAYDSSIYGLGEGKVVYISPDTISEPSEDGGNAPFYRVNLEVQTHNMRPVRAGERIDLQPGMNVTVEILTGSTTVWRYLTKPILKTTTRSLQEQ